MGVGPDKVSVVGLYAVLISSAVLSAFDDIVIIHWAND
jgi:hypothetical protein